MNLGLRANHPGASADPRLPRDQALALRALARSIQDPAAHRRIDRTPVVCVCSGKGGVGKSVVATNLSIVLARRGLEPVLIDADAGTPNADILLGLTPGRRINPGLDSSMDLRAAVAPTHDGLRFLAGPTDPDAYVGRTVDRLVDAACGLSPRPGVIVLDAGAGIGPAVRAPARVSDLALVVLTPDPTSIADAYALIKAIHLNRTTGEAPPRPLIGTVVNQAINDAEARRCHERLAQCAGRFLGLNIQSMGWLPSCGSVRAGVRDRRPAVVGEADSAFSASVRSLSGLICEHIRKPDNQDGWWRRAARFLRGGYSRNQERPFTPDNT
ncbi:MAG: P-loop NTPase [Phycisphaeraceae bacterium]|nr:P-loop NTPase [Phycisphaerae bacterium]MBX3392909.1 P-loop NTPase [Phycisphaeraceae bacterium]